MTPNLIQFKSEVVQELEDILSYWENYAIDYSSGGFYGEVSNINIPVSNAEKGSVLNARILWTFASAYNFTKDEKYLAIAERAYKYIIEFFIDKENGGVYWTVDNQGNPTNEKKQIYAQAFCIYGLSEYYKATNNTEALHKAVELYKLIETHAFDPIRTGYFEAFSRNWQSLEDIRLSEKDQNENKTMNTHLHIVEAYANLYSVWKDKSLKQRIVTVLNNFSQYFIDEKSHHLILFFDDDWNVQSRTISYGHDIEAAWLLQECAEIIKDELQIKLMKKHAVDIAKATLEGLDKDGGLWYEKDDILTKEKHWWPQSEAMIGFLNAFELSGDELYLFDSLNVWNFIRKKIKSKDGEWYWSVDANGKPSEEHYKVGLWKCPYHNVRACLEVAKRINNILMN